MRHYDAIVVGSGITGGFAAKELTERGLETLVLEAGRSIRPEHDYVEHVQPWDLHFRGLRNRFELDENKPIQKHCYACDEWAEKFFVNDRDHPYTHDPDKPFRWIRGRQVGGRSITWGRQTYRWSDLDFEANARDGIAIDWPIRYRDIEPWYDYVEDFIGISGQQEHLDHLPDSRFLPPMEMNCAEHFVRDGLRFLGYGECLPHPDNYVRLDPSVVDRWGVPTLNIHMKWRENEIAIRNDMADSAAEILEAVGARNVSPFIEKTDPGFTIHEMGTARMGHDPKTSVLNGFNQSHDIRNLFITDGACMTSSSCVNPSLTYMALTARACDYAMRQLDLGHI